MGSNPYDAFSPNGDGYNDYWTIIDIESFNDPVIQIFNRWGILIDEGSCDVLVDGEYRCWDGKDKNGKEVPVGTYYYHIHHNDDENNPTILKGSITLVR